VAVNSELSTRSGYTFYPEELLRDAAAHLKEQAHISICGLPGTGKSTFVRQLADLEVRKRLGLDQNYLMVLFDGQEFAHSSLEHVWGAILAAFKRACSSLSEVCKKDDAQRVKEEDFKEALHNLRHYRLVLVLGNCSGLHMGPERNLCHNLLHLNIMHRPTLIMIRNPACNREILSEFVPIDVTLSSEQALQFLDQALPQWGGDRALKNKLSREILGWVGGNLSLLDGVCYRAAEVGGNLPSRRAYPDFSRAVYDSCLRDAEPLFAAWWRILEEREQMVLLAMDELQRLTTSWQDAMKELSRKGLVQEQGDRHLISPKMFSDYVSKQPATRSAGPFQLDLRRIQIVHVDGKPRSLSRGQACAFFRLIVHRDQVVSCSYLYADLHSPYGYITEDKMHEMDASSMESVDRGLDELRKTLTVDKLIERISLDDNAPLIGYRLAVSSPGQDG